MKQVDAQDILGRATFRLAEAYPFIKNDYRRITPERRACEIILACKDLIELTSVEVSGNTRRNR